MEVTNKKAISLLLDHMAKGHKANTPSSLKRGLRAVEPQEHTARFALNYLDAFGYLSEQLSDWKDIQLGDIVDAVKQFQGFFGLKRSGVVCAKTIRTMQLPRCGCPDIVRDHHPTTKGMRDFVQVNLPRWRKTGIVYAIQDYLPGVSKPEFDSIIFNAFQSWCRYANVEVQPQRMPQQTVDIIISNGRGPQDQFDGPGGVLAWAYMPNGTDQQLLMKFDLDETWITNPAARGIIIANVACHEFGHLLGLDHSKLQSALMAPYYNAALAVPQQQDDIPRLQARYGARQDGNPTPSTPAAGDGSLVIHGHFDSVELNGQRVV